MLGINKYILGGTVIALALMGGYIWWQNSTIETLQENNMKLEQSVDRQKKVVEQTKQDMEDYRNAMERLSNEREELRQELNDLNERFNKQKPDGSTRDLGEIGVKKPGLLEGVLNSATNEANRCMELASGAKHTEEELNASKPSEINSECPVIANPNYNEKS